MVKPELLIHQSLEIAPHSGNLYFVFLTSVPII